LLIKTLQAQGASQFLVPRDWLIPAAATLASIPHELGFVSSIEAFLEGQENPEPRLPTVIIQSIRTTPDEVGKILERVKTLQQNEQLDLLFWGGKNPQVGHHALYEKLSIYPPVSVAAFTVAKSHQGA